MVVLFIGVACSSTPRIIGSPPQIGNGEANPDPAPGVVSQQSDPDDSQRPQDPLEQVSGSVDVDNHAVDTNNQVENGVSQTPSEIAQDQTVARLEELTIQNRAQLEEILALYRRIHIELDAPGRSALIVSLFHDPRIELELLGFELVDRDLSSSTVLSPEVGEQAKSLLDNPNPLIRSKAARLITRLVPLDAMIVLTASLLDETDPAAAEPMMNGIARWPSREATTPVLNWFLRSDSPFGAACNAAWSLEQAGLWDATTQHPQMLERLRKANPKELTESGMKLLSRLGDASDLRVLVSLMLMENTNQQQWAAIALVETPRAVEVLVQVAEENPLLYKSACDSLTRHRATPEGLRRLVALPYPDEPTRTESVVRMGAAVPNDRLADAVRLASLSPDLSVVLLNRLLNGNVEITLQVAKGIIHLAEIEHEQLRPNRALEAAITLDQVSLDPVDREKINGIKASSMIMIGKLPDALTISTDSLVWFASLVRVSDLELSKRVALFMIEHLSLTQSQLDQLEEYTTTPSATQPALTSD